MAEEGTTKKATSPPGAAPSREPYAKPTISWEEPLEDRPNLIAACAQRPGESDACNASPFS